MAGRSKDVTYVSISDAADALGLTRQRIWQLCQRGDLTPIPNPLDLRERLIPAEQVERLRPFSKKSRRGSQDERDHH